MIHPREIQILNILWKAGRPLASFEIVEEGDRLSQSTVQAVLRKLLKEELLETDGVIYSGNVLTRTYRPSPKTREIILEQILAEIEGAKYILGEDTIEEVKKILNA